MSDFIETPRLLRRQREGTIIIAMKRMMTGLLAVALLITAGCTASAKTVESYALDTICTQTVYSANADDAIAAVNAMLMHVTQTMSMNEGSEIDAVSKAAPQPVTVSEDTAALVQTALSIAAQTDGAFEPTIGVVSELWDISGSPRVPSSEELAAALALVSYQGVTVSGTDVSLATAGMMLDLGGIAKGYAADTAIEIYKEYGVESALLNLGGNIYVLGQRPDGTDYRIGLRDPQGGKGTYAAVVSVHDTSVVTSGVYERFFVQNGQTYHHILDPETGYPVNNGLEAVTVVCESSTLADALSTALFVMGPEDGSAAAETMDGVEAIFFTDDKRIIATDGIKDRIEITNETYTLSG
jgi:thiamine biosynthesis lipoprotein